MATIVKHYNPLFVNSVCRSFSRTILSVTRRTDLKSTVNNNRARRFYSLKVVSTNETSTKTTTTSSSSSSSSSSSTSKNRQSQGPALIEASDNEASISATIAKQQKQLPPQPSNAPLCDCLKPCILIKVARDGPNHGIYNYFFFFLRLKIFFF